MCFEKKHTYYKFLGEKYCCNLEENKFNEFTNVSEKTILHSLHFNLGGKKE